MRIAVRNDHFPEDFANLMNDLQVAKDASALEQSDRQNLLKFSNSITAVINPERRALIAHKLRKDIT